MKGLGIASCVLAAAIAAPAFGAEQDDKVDGAIWKFTMKKTGTRDAAERSGRFRIEGVKLFQRLDPRPLPPGTDLRNVKSEVIGKKDPKAAKGKAILHFEKLRSHTGDTIHEPVKGTARLEFDEYGKWHGQFIDADGKHWDFNAERVQE